MKFFWVQFLFYFITAFSFHTLFANELYKAGHQIAEESPEILLKEKGKWISVPADYMNPHLGMIKIYYYTSPNFDPNLPTVIYVAGGPGANAHEFWDLFSQAANENSFNIVFFDLRGVAFSRPDTLSLYQNRSLYSSKYVAHDMRRIMTHLKIKQWAVWGASYGTVPATIFASLFPKQTISVVLEGTVNDTVGKSYLQNYFGNILNRDLTSRLSEVGKENLSKIPKLSDFLFQTMYVTGTHGFAELADFLNNSDLHKRYTAIEANEPYSEKTKSALKKIVEKEYLKAAESLLIGAKKITAPPTKEGLSEFETRQWTEYDRMSGIDVHVLDSFESNEPSSPSNNRFWFNKEKGFYDPGEEPAKPFSHFQAIDFPISVPTTYLQGGADPVTTLAGAVVHYKSVPQNQKQMIIFPTEGHGPNHYLFFDQNKQWIETVFVPLIRGEMITPEKLVGFKNLEGKPLAVTTHRAPTALNCRDVFGSKK